MHDLTQCFERLGVGSDADTREIRRAYARELKKIDQVRDAAGFQQLREAYEFALRAVEQQDMAGAVNEPAPAPSSEPASEPESRSQSLLADPRRLADAAFLRLAADAGALADQQGWEAALLAVLAHDDLVNMAARSIFEARVAQALANGWQPGHELLFPAAVKVFCWGSDARRLAPFGHAGWVIGSAVDEWLMFKCQPEAQQHAQQAVMARLLQESVPSNAALRQFKFHFDTLVGNFPAVLAMMTDPGSQQRWQQSYAAMPHLPDVAMPIARKASRWHIFSGVPIAIFLIVSGLSQILTPKPEPAPVEIHAPFIVPQVEQAISEERLGEIVARIGYRPPANSSKNLIVAYEIFLTSNRTVLSLKKLTASGEAPFDDAVKRAILTSRPFPQNSVTRFTATFEFHLEPIPTIRASL